MDGTGQESAQIAGYNGSTPSLKMDSSDQPCIAWRRSNIMGDEIDIYYLYYNGSAWVDADGAGQEGVNVSANAYLTSSSPSLDLDQDDNPAIVWEDGSAMADQDMYYLAWNGSTWVDADGEGQTDIVIYDDSSNSSEDPILIFDNEDDPCIAWYNDEQGDDDIYYLEWYVEPDPDPDDPGDDDPEILPETGMEFVEYVNGLLL